MRCETHCPPKRDPGVGMHVIVGAIALAVVDGWLAANITSLLWTAFIVVYTLAALGIGGFVLLLRWGRRAQARVVNPVTPRALPAAARKAIEAPKVYVARPEDVLSVRREGLPRA